MHTASASLLNTGSDWSLSNPNIVRIMSDEMLVRFHVLYSWLCRSASRHVQDHETLFRKNDLLAAERARREYEQGICLA